MTDPEKTEDVEAELERDPERTLTVLQAMPVDTEFAEKMIRELVGELEEVEEERDRHRKMREHLSGVLSRTRDTRSEIASALLDEMQRCDAARRRSDRLEEVLVDAESAIESIGQSALGRDPKDGYYYRDELLSKIRSALDSREDEVSECTCERYAYAFVKDPECPVHGEDEGEEGIEIASTEWQHGEDGSQKWRAECPCGWKGNWSPIRGDATSEAEEHREHCPVHANEPEGDERDVAAEAGLRPLPEMRPVGESEGAGNPPWKPTAENVRRWAEIRKKNDDYDAYTRLVVIARELEDRSPPTDEPVSREGEEDCRAAYARAVENAVEGYEDWRDVTGAIDEGTSLDGELEEVVKAAVQKGWHMGRRVERFSQQAIHTEEGDGRIRFSHPEMLTSIDAIRKVASRSDEDTGHELLVASDRLEEAVMHLRRLRSAPHADARSSEPDYDADDVRQMSDEELVEGLESLAINFCQEAGFGYMPVKVHALEIKRRLSSGEEDCPLCGHPWRKHDPEDGLCDAGAGLDGHCPCGRNLAWMRSQMATHSSPSDRHEEGESDE